MKKSLTFGFNTATEYRQHFEQFREMVSKNEDISLEQMVQDYRAGEMGLDMFRRRAITFLDQKTRISDFYVQSDVGTVRVKSQQLKDALLPSPRKSTRRWREHFRNSPRTRTRRSSRRCTTPRQS